MREDGIKDKAHSIKIFFAALFSKVADRVKNMIKENYPSGDTAEEKYEILALQWREELVKNREQLLDIPVSIRF